MDECADNLRFRRSNLLSGSHEELLKTSSSSYSPVTELFPLSSRVSPIGDCDTAIVARFTFSTFTHLISLSLSSPSWMTNGKPLGGITSTTGQRTEEGRSVRQLHDD